MKELARHAYGLIVTIVAATMFLAPSFDGHARCGDQNMSDETHDKLVKMLTKGTVSERMTAAKRLGENKDSKAIAPLLKSLHDPDQMVRAWSSWALGKIGDRSAILPLVEALNKYMAISTTDYCESESRCIPDICTALEELTGKKYGLDVKKWNELAKNIQQRDKKDNGE